MSFFFSRFVDEPVYFERLGQRIAKLRLARGMTQAKLAEAAGMDPATVSRAETGAQRLSVKRLFAIARALEIDLPDLFPSSGTGLSGNDAEDVPVELRRAWNAIPAERRELAVRLLEEMTG